MLKPKKYKKAPPDYLRDYILDVSEQWVQEKPEKRIKSVKSLTDRQAKRMLAACIDLIIILANCENQASRGMAQAMGEALLKAMAKPGVELTTENMRLIYIAFMDQLLHGQLKEKVNAA